MAKVKLADGRMMEVPDGSTPEQVQQYVNQVHVMERAPFVDAAGKQAQNAIERMGREDTNPGNPFGSPSTAGLEHVVQQFGQGMGAPPKPSDVATGPLEFIKHPIQRTKDLLSAMTDAAQGTVDRAYFDQHTGNVSRGLARGVYSALPVVGPALEGAGEQMSTGDVSGGLAKTGGLATGMTVGSPEARAAAVDVATLPVRGGKAVLQRARNTGLAPDVAANVMNRTMGVPASSLDEGVNPGRAVVTSGVPLAATKNGLLQKISTKANELGEVLPPDHPLVADTEFGAQALKHKMNADSLKSPLNMSDWETGAVASLPWVLGGNRDLTHGMMAAITGMVIKKVMGSTAASTVLAKMLGPLGEREMNVGPVSAPTPAPAGLRGAPIVTPPPSAPEPPTIEGNTTNTPLLYAKPIMRNGKPRTFYRGSQQGTLSPTEGNAWFGTNSQMADIYAHNGKLLGGERPTGSVVEPVNIRGKLAKTGMDAEELHRTFEDSPEVIDQLSKELGSAGFQGIEAPGHTLWDSGYEGPGSEILLFDSRGTTTPAFGTKVGTDQPGVKPQPSTQLIKRNTETMGEVLPPTAPVPPEVTAEDAATTQSFRQNLEAQAADMAEIARKRDFIRNKADIGKGTQQMYTPRTLTLHDPEGTPAIEVPLRNKQQVDAVYGDDPAVEGHGGPGAMMKKGSKLLKSIKDRVLGDEGPADPSRRAVLRKGGEAAVGAAASKLLPKAASDSPLAGMTPEQIAKHAVAHNDLFARMYGDADGEGGILSNFEYGFDGVPYDALYEVVDAIRNSDAIHGDPLKMSPGHIKAINDALDTIENAGDNEDWRPIINEAADILQKNNIMPSAKIHEAFDAGMRGMAEREAERVKFEKDNAGVRQAAERRNAANARETEALKRNNPEPAYDPSAGYGGVPVRTPPFEEGTFANPRGKAPRQLRLERQPEGKGRPGMGPGAMLAKGSRLATQLSPGPSTGDGLSLFHGTKSSDMHSIIENGIRAEQHGRGRAYLTEDPEVARMFSYENGGPNIVEVQVPRNAVIGKQGPYVHPEESNYVGLKKHQGEYSAVTSGTTISPKLIKKVLTLKRGK